MSVFWKSLCCICGCVACGPGAFDGFVAAPFPFFNCQRKKTEKGREAGEGREKEVQTLKSYTGLERLENKNKGQREAKRENRKCWTMRRLLDNERAHESKDRELALIATSTPRSVTKLRLYCAICLSSELFSTRTRWARGIREVSREAREEDTVTPLRLSRSRDRPSPSEPLRTGSVGMSVSVS